MLIEDFVQYVLRLKFIQKSTFSDKFDHFSRCDLSITFDIHCSSILQ